MKNKMKIMVPKITPNSSLRDLTLSLLYSFEDREQKIVEDILTTREQEGELKRKILEEEVESLREKCEELKKRSDLMENVLSFQKREMEDERRLQREMLENQNDHLQTGFKRELEKMRECHNEERQRDRDIMEKKLSLAVVEKLQLEEEVKKSVIQNEEGRKEVEKMKKNYEEELNKCRKRFQEKLQVLELNNLELNKKVEQHMEIFSKIKNFAELIKGAYDSAISGNVRANEVLGNGSDAGEKASNVDGHLIEYPVSSGEPLLNTHLQTEVKCLRGKHTDIQLGEKSECLFLENELEDGGHNENNCSLKSKRKRSINESEDDGIGLCSANSREPHVISSKNKEFAGCQTEKSGCLFLENDATVTYSRPVRCRKPNPRYVD